MKNKILTDALIEALPYIQQFTGKIVVIKYGGAAMIDKELKASFAQDISLLHHLGMKIIIVHGGGKEMTELAEKLQLETQFVQGKRVTNEAMLDIVKMVLAGKINKEIVCNLNRQNIKAIGISGQDGDLLKCRKAFLPTGEDIGWVGEIIHVNTKILLDMLEDGLIPVIAPVGYDDDGNSYNINADDAAGDIASAFPAEKLIYLTDTDGVYFDPDDPDSANASGIQPAPGNRSASPDRHNPSHRFSESHARFGNHQRNAGKAPGI